jgi:hypothetical protein
MKEGVAALPCTTTWRPPNSTLAPQPTIHSHGPPTHWIGSLALVAEGEAAHVQKRSLVSQGERNSVLTCAQR